MSKELWPDQADEDFKAEVAELLREYLEKRAMTQRELARRIEVHHNAIQRWLTADRAISFETWTKIAAVLRIPRRSWPSAKAVA